MKILDTTFLIDLLRGKKGLQKIVETDEPLFTTQLNMYEVIRGLFYRNISARKMAEANDLFENIKVLSLDDNSIIKAAEISAELTKQGEMISDCDCMMAGIASSKGMNKIVTRNAKHFRKIKGMTVETY